MSTLTDRTISALRTSYDDLAMRVRAFSDEDLDRMSGASEWDVAQVLSHLGSASEIGLAVLRSALDGVEGPDQDANRRVWARWDALGQREKADGYLEWFGLLMTAYEELDATARRDLRVILGFLPAPADVALITGMRLNEALLHSWDVRVAFDPDAVLPEDGVAVLLEQTRGPLAFLLGFIGKPAGLDGAVARLCVETTDPEAAFGLAIEESVSLGDVPEDSDGVVTGPAEAFLRLVSGRLAVEHTPDAFRVDSPLVSLDQLRRVFPGV